MGCTVLAWSGDVKRQVSVVECHEVFLANIDTYSSKLIEVGSQLTANQDLSQ